MTTDNATRSAGNPETLPELSFGEWLCGQVVRTDDVGELARGYLQAIDSGDVRLRANNTNVTDWIAGLEPEYAGAEWGSAAELAAAEYRVWGGCGLTAGVHTCRLAFGHPEPHFCEIDHAHLMD